MHSTSVHPKILVPWFTKGFNPIMNFFALQALQALTVPPVRPDATGPGRTCAFTRSTGELKEHPISLPPCSSLFWRPPPVAPTAQPDTAFGTAAAAADAGRRWASGRALCGLRRQAQALNAREASRRAVPQVCRRRRWGRRGETWDEEHEDFSYDEGRQNFISCVQL